jgi:hypothetical protein
VLPPGVCAFLRVKQSSRAGAITRDMPLQRDLKFK